MNIKLKKAVRDLLINPGRTVVIYLALVIGCGSKIFAWMNDSGFWVVCTMSGMTEGETLKTSSVVLSIMGVIGLFVVMIFAKIFPLI